MPSTAEKRLSHELLDGEHVVTPAPSVEHQRVVRRLLVLLDAQLPSDALEVLTSPADVRLSSRTLVQPDVLVVRSYDERPAREWRDVGVPLMAIEIVSPSNRIISVSVAELLAETEE